MQNGMEIYVHCQAISWLISDQLFPYILAEMLFRGIKLFVKYSYKKNI